MTSRSWVRGGAFRSLGRMERVVLLGGIRDTITGRAIHFQARDH
jgi:hypothetical protein